MQLYYSKLDLTGEGDLITATRNMGGGYTKTLKQYPRFKVGETTLLFKEGGEEAYVYIKKTDGYGVGVSISAYPNNCGLVILHGISTNANVEMVNYYVELCRIMGYSQIQYTVAEQATITELITKAGFVPLKGSEVKNQRSGNLITTYILNLNTEEEEDNAD